jgi:hypothetical protein
VGSQVRGNPLTIAALFAWDTHTHLIKKSGRPNSFWGWYSLLVPVYLFVRAAKLKLSNIHAWIWLGCAVLIIIAWQALP